ncbi:MAG: biotin-independent malonate decarboxylase subunit gamma [Defluviitaleaceae bacterium]|nr:biotin-independent malonate decarboxylase subunit gamma [Defluviitaleaceae bacterium]
MTQRPKTLVGKGREAMLNIIDADSFIDGKIGDATLDTNLGPGALIGTATMSGETVTVITNDAKARNPRFPVVYAGIIGLEEAYKMAQAVYLTMEADKNLPKKRPLVLVIDSPGNAPGKVEEFFGMNLATGSYQLALAEARTAGHPIIAMIVGRAISGAFLCHGLQADRILALPQTLGTMIHVMPLSSIARITKRDVELLETLSQTNPVFASGAGFFYKLGGLEEIIEDPADMPKAIVRHIQEIYKLKSEGKWNELGPCSRGTLGTARGGRVARKKVLDLMQTQYAKLEEAFLA